MTSGDTRAAISSPESASGTSPARLHDGPQMSLFGLEAAPAHLSPQQGKSKNVQTARAETLYRALQELAISYAAYAATHGMPIRDISGPNTGGSSAMSARSASMENRLRQRMGAYGSPEYELAWKYWPMPLGEPILALRASERRTSGSEFIGWPTPCVPNGGRRPKAGMDSKGQTADGKKRQVDAEYIARQIVGWATPKATDGTHGGPNQRGSKGDYYLPAQAHHAQINGWATPSSRDWKDTPGMAQEVKIEGGGYSEADGSTGAASIHPFWREYELVVCREPDGTEKLRRIESRTFPLAHGYPERVGILHAAGDAINPWLAGEFVASTMPEIGVIPA